MNIKKIDQSVIYEGAVFNLVKKTFQREDGSTFIREIVESPKVVHVLPIDKNDMLYCINEFRSSVEENVIGFPAGKIDEGETPEDAAKREVEEEIGMKVIELVPIQGNLTTTMGICNEVCYFYLAIVEEFKENERKHFPDADENINVVKLSINDFIKRLNDIITNKKPLGLKTVFLWAMFMITTMRKESIRDELK
jgi:ADP-ribose pyrophosphatase